MIARSANLFETVDHIGCQSSFTSGRCVENDIAVSGVERNEPLIDNSCCRLQVAMTSRCFQNHWSVRVTQDKAGISLCCGTF